MAALNKVILIGRLTANPELKTTQSGVAVTSFCIAVERKYGKDGNKETDFINIVAWRQTAEFICKYFGKGNAIIICGELQTRSWKDEHGNTKRITEVLASEASFADSKKAAETKQSSAEESASEGFVEVGEEDLPF